MKTPKDYAKGMIRYYVLRGDTYEQLCAGQQGQCGPGEPYIHIGGFINQQKIKRDDVAVEFDDKFYIFRLKDLMAEILNEQVQPSLF